jgi:D-arabinose 1-dehydrogenase-like Zn-dependent alcohol dehydrogenase
MHSVQVSEPNGPLQIVEKDIPEPGNHQVRIKVQACGICHSDSVTKEGVIARHRISEGSWARNGKCRVC